MTLSFFRPKFDLNPVIHQDASLTIIKDFKQLVLVILMISVCFLVNVMGTNCFKNKLNYKKAENISWSVSGKGVGMLNSMWNGKKSTKVFQKLYGIVHVKMLYMVSSKTKMYA